MFQFLPLCDTLFLQHRFDAEDVRGTIHCLSIGLVILVLPSYVLMVNDSPPLHTLMYGNMAECQITMEQEGEAFTDLNDIESHM